MNNVLSYRANHVTPKIDGRRLSFYATVYNTPARIKEGGKVFNEMILPTAFNESLQSGGEVFATIQHDPAKRFALRSTGELLLQSDSKGIFASVWLPENAAGDAVKEQVEEGQFRGASIGFYADEYVDENGTAVLHKGRLFDVSLVDIPAYPTGEPHLRNDEHIKMLLRKLRFLSLRHT